MEKQLKVEEIYECLALLNGFENPVMNVKIPGFAKEKAISEGMRRIANKIAKKLSENWPQEQFNEINSIEKIEGEETDVSKLMTYKQEKIKELTSSVVTMNFEELPDFKMLDARLEDRKETLSYDYTYLFERLFLNY